MAKARITYIAPHAVNDCIMRVCVGKRHADFRGRKDGTWRDLAATERDRDYLAAVLDAQSATIAAVYR